MKILDHSVSYDVVVVGGGPGGITAAIAAARSGAKTLLIEEDLVLGGALTDYYVAMLCGRPTQGILLEILQECIQKYRLQRGINWFMPASWIKAIANITEKEPNLTIMTGAKLVDVETCGDKIKSVIVLCESVMRRISGKVFVEATGTGLFAELAGCEIMYGRDARSDFNEKYAPEKRDEQVQHVTWMYISHKLPGFKPFDMSKLENAKLGILPQEDIWFHIDPQRAINANDGVYLHWGCRVECKDTRDSVAIGQAQQEALKLMERDHALLRENGYIVSLAPKIGLREIRRVKGLHVLSGEEIIDNLFPDDTIAVGKYVLDVWGENGVSSDKPKLGYVIPYRSLVPLKVSNLLLSGRVISGAHIAMSSYRVMPIVGNIGQAAGLAAGLCALNNTSPDNIDVSTLQKMLVGPGQNQILTP